jgi:hypothetical protein
MERDPPNSADEAAATPSHSGEPTEIRKPRWARSTSTGADHKTQFNMLCTDR